MKNAIILFFCMLNLILWGQIPYTESSFNWRIESNILYQQSIDYAGNTQQLNLDLYKPTNNSHCNRPILIVVHGGAWIAGSKEDINCQLIAKEMAKRGYVVASINYRLGTHKTSNYSMYALCSNSISQPCGYISDSAEVYRANFRGIQDAKDAIRFMKSRTLLDSTDANSVFICGESAGGFIALGAAYMDKPEEKPAPCLSIANAPTPASSLSMYGCIPFNLSTARPDLGSIDGNNTSNTVTATVQGVGNFYGGLMDLSILPIDSTAPVLYAYHQGADVVVHYNFGRLLGRTSWECYQQSNICQPYYFYPYSHGSKSISTYLTNQQATLKRKIDVTENYAYLNNCFSNGHSIDNVVLRTQNMAELFAQRLVSIGNTPTQGCQLHAATESVQLPEVLLNQHQLVILSAEHFTQLTIHDALGRIVQSGKVCGNHFELSHEIKSGNYVIELVTDAGKRYTKRLSCLNQP